MRVSPECLDALNAQEDKDPDAVTIIREQTLGLKCGVIRYLAPITAVFPLNTTLSTNR